MRKTILYSILAAALVAFAPARAAAQAPSVPRRAGLAIEAPLPPGREPALPAPALERVVHAGGGVVLRSADGGALVVAPAAFEPGSATLGRAAARDLARAGRALRDLGVGRLRVVTYRDVGPVSDDLASRRAVALARALARGGYPPADIALEVGLGSGAEGAGRILVAGRCLNACDVPATPRR